MEVQVVAVETDRADHVSTVSTVSALDGSTSRHSFSDLDTDSGYSASGDGSLDLGVDFASSYLFVPLETVRGLYPEVVAEQIVAIVRDVLTSDFPAGNGERGREQPSTSTGAGAERPEPQLQLEVSVVRKAFDLVVEEYSDILLGSHVLFLTRLIGAVSDHIKAGEEVPHDLDFLEQQLDEVSINEYGRGTEEHLKWCLTEVCALLPSLSGHQVRSLLMELLAKVSHVVQECIVTKLLSTEEGTCGESDADREALDEEASAQERPKDILDCALLQLCQVRLNQNVSLICTVVDRVLLGADSQGPTSEEEPTHSRDAKTLCTILSTAFRNMATSDPHLEVRRVTQWIFAFFNFVIEPVCWLSVAYGFDQVHEFSKLSISRKLVRGALQDIFFYQPGLSDEVILRAAEQTLERQLREDDSPPLEDLSRSASEETVDAFDPAEEPVETNHQGAEESNPDIGLEAHTSEFGQSTTETPTKESVRKVLALVYPTVPIDLALVERLHQRIWTTHTEASAPLDSSTLHVRVYNHMCDEWLRSAQGPSRGDPAGEEVEELIIKMFLKNLSVPQKKPCCIKRICGRVLSKLDEFLCCFAPGRNKVCPVHH